MRVILAQPRGFCAGVERAITIVERALEIYGAPIYVRHEIVHNKWVVEDLRARGVVFVNELTEVPEGAMTIMSAHGVSQRVMGEAQARNLPVIDATCPLVTKVHREAQRYEAENREIILIGHRGHPEVEGTSGQVRNGMILVESVEDVARIAPRQPDNLAYVTQTTLSLDDTRAIIDALKARFPTIAGPDTKDICYATQNRQNAVRALAEQADLVLVIGSKNSSNSNRLRDLATELGRPAHLVDGGHDIDVAWLNGVATLGITAGASAPERLVEEVLDRLRVLCSQLEVSTLDGIVENVKFKLPPEVEKQVA